jgi:hypothetical protein
MASAEFEPANLGTKGQHATSRPLKPSITTVTKNNSTALAEIALPRTSKALKRLTHLISICIPLLAPVVLWRGFRKCPNRTQRLSLSRKWMFRRKSGTQGAKVTEAEYNDIMSSILWTPHQTLGLSNKG